MAKEEEEVKVPTIRLWLIKDDSIIPETLAFRSCSIGIDMDGLGQSL